MKVNYKKLLFNFAFWLITELLLNLVGLDDLANYSEFIFSGGNIKLSSCSYETPVQLRACN
jgi:hypothetical protein